MWPELGQSNAPALRHQLGNERRKAAGLGEAYPRPRAVMAVVRLVSASFSISSVEGSATAD